MANVATCSVFLGGLGVKQATEWEAQRQLAPLAYELSAHLEAMEGRHVDRVALMPAFKGTAILQARAARMRHFCGTLISPPVALCPKSCALMSESQLTNIVQPSRGGKAAARTTVPPSPDLPAAVCFLFGP